MKWEKDAFVDISSVDRRIRNTKDSHKYAVTVFSSSFVNLLEAATYSVIRG